MVQKRPSSPKSEISPPPTKRKITSSTTSTAVSNFFKPISKKDPELLQWRIVDNSLIIGKYAVPKLQTAQTDQGACRVAAFDLDDTLIKSTAGKFTKSATGWKWWDTCVPGQLNNLHKQGYQIVILTNQSAISLKDDPKSLQRDKASYRNFKDQLAAVLRQLNLPISVFAATERDRFRKPREGMWNEMLEELDLDAVGAVDLQKSFFIGDAAGRDKADDRPKDHSSCDRDLAANVGIGFHTPEEYFLGRPAEPFTRAFDPALYLRSTEGASSPNTTFTKRNDQDIVLFCGSPGAGKSTFYSRYLKPLSFGRNVEPADRRKREKCLKVAAGCLENEQSIAIDNTNANIETRLHWIELSTRFNVPIRCVHFTASPRLCEHNDTVRSFNIELMNPENRAALPAAAFRGYASRYEEPTLKEGFQDILQVDFQFSGTADQRDVWRKYWVTNFSV